MSFALCRDMCSTCTLSRFLPPCVHVCTVYAFVCVLVFVFGVFSLPSLVNSLSHLMQEAEQPLGAGVYDTPTFSKPTSVKQVMDMPTYSDVFQSKVNIMHLDVYKPTNKCQSGLEQCFCTSIICQNCSNSIIMELGLVPGSFLFCVCAL